MEEPSKMTKNSVTDARALLRKVYSHNKIVGLAQITKEFLEQYYHIPPSITFHEISGYVKRRRIQPDQKDKIARLGQWFEEREYRPGRITPHEIKEIKKLMKELLSVYVLPINPKKVGFLKRRSLSVKKAENAKQKFIMRTQRQIQQAIEANLRDHEWEEMLAFAKISREIGKKKKKIFY